MFTVCGHDTIEDSRVTGVGVGVGMAERGGSPGCHLCGANIKS